MFGVLMEWLDEMEVEFYLHVRRVPHTRPILYNELDMKTGLGLISLSKLLTQHIEQCDFSTIN